MSLPSVDRPFRADARPPVVRVLDGLLLGTLVLLASALLFGGVRIKLGDVRLTAESWWKLTAVLVVLLAARRGLWAGPSWPRHVRDRVVGWWRDPAVRAVLPRVVVARLLVLYATYLGVVVMGYPEGAPPFRASQNEAGNLLARWDAGWYSTIAEVGYNYWGNARAQTNVAFFPAYPYTVRVAGGLLGARWGSPDHHTQTTFEAFTESRLVRLLVGGWLVSVVAFGWGLVYLYRLARDLTDSEDAATGAVALTIAYPFGFFYGAVYTEGLFLLCATATAWHFRHRRWAWAAVAGVLAGLTRPNGCLLSVPLGLLAVDAWRRDDYRWQTLAVALPVAAGPGLGMLAFTTWLYGQTGEWFLWMQAHGAWGRELSGVHVLLQQRWKDLREWGLYTYSVTHTIEMLNMAATGLVIATSWAVGRRVGWAWSAFVLVTVLPPLFMGGFLSMGRVTSTLFPTFIYLGWALRGTVREQVQLAAFGLQVALAIMHFTWRQVF